MSNKEWFNFFKQMNPEHAHLFSDQHFFTIQVNNIIELGLFPNLSKEITKYPNYKVIYTLSDKDYFDSVLEDCKDTNDNESKSSDTSKFLFNFNNNSCIFIHQALTYHSFIACFNY